MKRREFLGSCAAALVVPAIPCLPKPEKPKEPQKGVPMPAPAMRKFRSLRQERYRKYEQMLEDPAVLELLQKVCDGAMQSIYNDDEIGKVSAYLGCGSAPWQHSFADYWVYAPEMQKKHPFAFAQKINGLHVVYGDKPVPESPRDYRNRKHDRDAFWDFAELVSVYWGTFGTSYKMRDWLMSLATYGDLFIEPVWDPERPHLGVCGTSELPAHTVYRVETIHGSLVEFQQSSDGVDYASITRKKVEDCVLHQDPESNAVRFRPQDLIHCRIPDIRPIGLTPASKKVFKSRMGVAPYGVSLLEYLDAKQPIRLETHSCWFVNLLRNSLLNGLETLGKRHLQLRNAEFDFCLL